MVVASVYDRTADKIHAVKTFLTVVLCISVPLQVQRTTKHEEQRRWLDRQSAPTETGTGTFTGLLVPLRPNFKQ